MVGGHVMFRLYFKLGQRSCRITLQVECRVYFTCDGVHPKEGALPATPILWKSWQAVCSVQRLWHEGVVVRLHRIVKE